MSLGLGNSKISEPQAEYGTFYRVWARGAETSGASHLAMWSKQQVDVL